MSTVGHPDSPAGGLTLAEAAELELAVSRRWVVLVVQTAPGRRALSTVLSHSW